MIPPSHPSPARPRDLTPAEHQLSSSPLGHASVGLRATPSLRRTASAHRTTSTAAAGPARHDDTNGHTSHQSAVPSSIPLGSVQAASITFAPPAQPLAHRHSGGGEAMRASHDRRHSERLDYLQSVGSEELPLLADGAGGGGGDWPNIGGDGAHIPDMHRHAASKATSERSAAGSEAGSRTAILLNDFALAVINCIIVRLLRVMCCNNVHMHAVWLCFNICTCL